MKSATLFVIVTVGLASGLIPIFADAKSIARSDVDEITRVVSAIGNTADAKDWRGCRDQFAGEVLADYSALTGQPATRVNSDQLIEGWKQVLGPVKATQHIITNFIVNVSGNRAVVHSYVQAVHHHPISKGQDFWILFGRYEHELQKQGTRWRVTRMKLTPVYQQGNKDLLKQVGEEQAK